MLLRTVNSMLLALVVGTQLFGQEIVFRAEVDRTEIATGDAVKLTITLENASGSGMTTPDLGGLEVLRGPLRSNSFTSINGRMTRSSTTTWYLTATRPGRFTIGPSTVHVGKGEIKTDPITITAVKGASGAGPAAEQGQQRNANMFCTITLSKNKAYVGEQVIATYTLFSRYNSLRQTDTELPKLNGFWAEEVDLGSSTSWEQQLRTVNGMQYRVAVLKKQVLIPLRSGKLTIAPMSLDFMVNPSFFSSGTPVRIQSNTGTLQVMELPAGKPSDFTGAVGTLKLEMEASPTRLKADEAIDLTFRFSGRANLKLLDAPKLNLPPGFELYDPKVNDRISVTSSGMSGSREFQYLVIPRTEGHYELDELTFSYFNPATGQYEQLRSQPLVLDVEPGEGITAGSGGAPKVDVQRLGSDIRYIRTGDLHLRPTGRFLMTTPLYAVGMAAPPLLLLVFFLWYKRREDRLGDVQGQRRRAADRLARKRLAKAKAALDAGDTTAFNDALGKALEGYFTDKFNLGVAELDQAAIHRELAGFDGGKTANDLSHLIARSQMARFAPGMGEPDSEAYEQAVELIARIENLVRK